eukprot:CAMPEP_0170611592 /NCGR_PEP_ID=MMETSP0224-20130122/23268_1 /TAXON_ID=285029 /ORGANISM="Togula jolla, Strain CCCM 725" /LENGTH=46 /DNA_ID= /DNA_START= /DNA_END= /DNA_ORIENTATION=
MWSSPGRQCLDLLRTISAQSWDKAFRQKLPPPVRAALPTPRVWSPS